LFHNGTALTGLSSKFPSKQRRSAHPPSEKRSKGAYEIQRQGSDSGILYLVGIGVSLFSADEENLYGSCPCPESRSGGGAAPEFRSGAPKFGASTPKFGAGALCPIASKLIDAAPIIRFIRVASDNLAPNVAPNNVAPNNVAPKQVPHSIVQLSD